MLYSVVRYETSHKSDGGVNVDFVNYFETDDEISAVLMCKTLSLKSQQVYLVANDPEYHTFKCAYFHGEVM